MKRFLMKRIQVLSEYGELLFDVITHAVYIPIYRAYKLITNFKMCNVIKLIDSILLLALYVVLIILSVITLIASLTVEPDKGIETFRAVNQVFPKLSSKP